MMPESTAKAAPPAAAPASAVPTDRPTDTTVSSSSPSVEPAAEPPASQSDAEATPVAVANGSRKRVFTFQKRWLHTLPIMEKVLPDSALDAASVVALRAANLLGEDGKPVDDAGAREVIVCMLCDDPNSTRETLKLWSRLNCRRGRIENHLMSKHPEFMLLLKQKRESEGDLAVQIFLQNMREGRCNVRNEISAGLYSHMQPIPSVDLAGGSHKRAFGHDEFMMPATSAVTTGSNAALSSTTAGGPSVSSTTGAFQSKHGQAAFNHDATAEATLDAETRRKRMKTNGNAEVLTGSAGADGTGDLLSTSLLFFQGPAAFSQWRTLLSSKMVVVTGGEMASIARIATNLWLVGANVLVTFAEQNAMEAFAASYLTQFHAAGGMEPPRGVMLPLFCSLQSQTEIEEWSRSIATKFGHVDYLINFIHDDTSPPSSGDPTTSTNANRCQDICQAFSGSCMQRSRRNSIINITTEIDASHDSATTLAVEAVTKTLSTQLLASNVQVNSVVLQQSHSTPTGDEDIELIHLILFLLSPASACVSGSVLRHRRAGEGPARPSAHVDHSASTPLDPHTSNVSAVVPGEAAASTLTNSVDLETEVI